MRPAAKLDRDGSGAFRDGWLAAIFDKSGAGFRRKSSRVLFGLVDLPLFALFPCNAAC
jgi:hypothetical protein